MYLVQFVSCSRETTPATFYINDPVDFETEENFLNMIKKEHIYKSEELSSSERDIYIQDVNDKNCEYVIPLKVNTVFGDYFSLGLALCWN